MRSIALDVHQSFCEVAICERGEVRSAGRVKSERCALELFAESLDPADQVVMEATGPAMEIARIIEPHVARVVVANAQDVRAISHARVKSDRFDARTLARLLDAGMLETVWVPEEATQELRRRVARRAALVRQRTRAKNEVHAVLARCLLGRSPVSDLFGSGGRAWLARQDLPASEVETVAGCLRQIDFLGEEIEAIDVGLCEWVSASPEAKRLMTIPGIGVGSAAALMAAIGDVSRFSSPRKLVAYLGLDAKVRQSGESAAQHGQISKRGNAQARAVLVEAAWIAVRSPGPLRAFSERLRARKHSGVAAVAVARKIACLCWQLLSKEEDYAFGRPSLVRAKLRRAELSAGAAKLPQRHGAAGSAPPRKSARRARAGRARRDRLPTTRRRLALGGAKGRRRDRWARIFWALYGASSAAGQSPKARALARRLPAPAQTLANGGASGKVDLTFIRTDCAERDLCRPGVEDTKAERVVLAFLLEEHPSQLAIPELSLALNADPGFGSDDAVERAVRELVGAGLLYCQGRFVLPTRAALYFARLGDGLMPADVARQFAANLRKARRCAGLSQEEAGWLASLHWTEIGLLETGARTPRIDTLVKVAGCRESAGRVPFA